MFFLLIYLIFLPQFKPGHIFSQPSSFSPQNAGISSTFQLFFLLETPLLPTDYLYIKFPFPIGFSAKAFISDPISPISSQISTNSFPNQENTEFFQINDPLSSNKWFLLSIFPSEKSTQKPGFLGCIFFATTSDKNTENMLIYDINPCFDVISFANPIDNTNFEAFGLVSHRDSSRKTVFSENYQVFFEITLNKEVSDASFIEITIEKDFVFDAYCTSLPCILNDSPTSDCPITYNISQLKDFNCEGNNRILKLYMPNTINHQRIRIAATVKNPRNLTISRISAAFLGKNSFFYCNMTIFDKNGKEFLLETKYQEIVIKADSFLFWGLFSENIKGKKGFLGCPISLYQSDNYVVFNSFSTIFTVDKFIDSFEKNGFLTVFWCLIDVKNAISAFLMNSLSTNLPVLKENCQFSSENSTIFCRNIGGIPVGKYQISGKFSLEGNFLLKSMYNCGKIEIKTGDFQTISSSKFSLINMRKNNEFFDGKITINNNYNRLFSYVYSENYDFSPKNLIKTIKNQFIGGGDQNSKPKSGVFTKENQEIFGVFLMLFVKKSQICIENYEGLMSSCENSMNSFAVLLKIVFNNNVFNINSSDFSKGVQIIGTLFKTIDLKDFSFVNNGKIADYGHNSVDFLSNSIDVYKGNYGSAFWHVSVTCKSEIFNNFPENSCYNILGFSEENPVSAAGIGFLNMKITKYPSFYADDMLFDMILCVKLANYDDYTRDSPIQNEENWLLFDNSTGIIHGYIITNTVISSKIAFSNVYLEEKITGMHENPEFKANFPSFLRISFVIPSEKIIETGNFLGVFLEGDQPSPEFNVFHGLSAYSDENVINIADFTQGNMIQGNVFQAYTSENPYISMTDHFFTHHSVIFPYKIQMNSPVFVYIPLQTTFSEVFSLNIAILQRKISKNAEFSVISVYRVFGSVFDNSEAFSMKLSVFPLGVKQPKISLTSTWDLSASGSGCVNNGKKKPGLPENSIFLPSQVYSKENLNEISFKSDVQYPDAISCDISKGNSEIQGWGGLFGIISYENIFDNVDLEWSYKGNDENKCIFLNVFVSDYNKTLYTILCSTDASKDLSMNFGENGLVSLSLFRSPFYWGSNYPIDQTLRYIWSNPKGLAVLIQPEANTNIEKWMANSCKIENIDRIAENTKDTSFFLNLQSKVLYKIAKNSNLTIKHEILNYEGNMSFCRHKSLNCLIFNGTSYILKAFDDEMTENTEDFFLLEGTISIEVFTDSKAMIETTNSAIFEYNGYDIELCSSEISGFQINGAFIDKKIKLGELKYVEMRNTRGNFAFSFEINRVLMKEYDILFDFIGFFNENDQNYRCFVNKNSAISHDFLSLKWLTSNSFMLKTKDFIRNPRKYEFSCINIVISEEFSINSTISAVLERSFQGISLIESNILSPLNEIKPLNLSKTLIFNKTCKNSGFDADYSFNFTIENLEIPLDGRIYIEFSSLIAPKLNSEGFLECFIDKISAICEFFTERKIMIFPVFPMKLLKEYQVKILSITQPFINENMVKQSIFLTLDEDNDVFNGISEQFTIEDSFEIAIPDVIIVKNLRFSCNFIRNYTDLTFSLIIPVDKINENNDFWVKLPKSFGNLMILTRISCEMRGESSFVLKDCEVFEGRRIKMKLKNDSMNIDPQNYSLIIKNLTTPQRNSTRNGFLFYITDQNQEILAFSRNNDIFMEFVKNKKIIDLFFEDSSNNNGNNDYFTMNFGVFHNEISLTQKNSVFFNESFNISLQNLNASDPLLIIPSILSIEPGMKVSKFKIAGKPTVNQGLYYIKSSINQKNLSYSLPNFFKIKLIFSQFSPSISSKNIDVPYKGQSSPIIIDFSQYLPENSISVIANLTYGFFENNISFSNKSTIFKTLDFSNENTKIFFYLNCDKNTDKNNQEKIEKAAVISFKFSGKDADFYKNFDDIFVNLLPDVLEEPMIKSIEIEEFLLKIACNQPGKLYFFLGISSKFLKDSLLDIYNKTERVFTEITEPNINDSWIIYGFSANLQEDMPVFIDLTDKLKANENYAMIAYCSNLNNVNSSKPGNFSWLQKDNGGVGFVIRIIVNISIDSANKSQMACFIARILTIPYKRVWTDEAMYCNMKETINKSNHTEPLSKKIVNFTYDFIITKDFLSKNDDFSFENVNKSEFFDKIIDLIRNSNNHWIPQILEKNIFSYESSQSSQQGLYEINIVNTTIDVFSFNITLEMRNSSGNIIAGIAINQTKPTFYQLFQGFNGNSTSLIQKGKVSCDFKERIWFNFTNLQANQSYWLFLAGSNYDTSPNSVHSEVIMVEILTKNKPVFVGGMGLFAFWREIMVILIILLQ